MCTGCPSAMEMKWRLTWVCWVPDNSILAFSAASFNRDMACLSLDRSMPVFLEFAHHPIDDLVVEIIATELLFPAVAFTSISRPAVDFVNLSTEIDVPPPKS